MKKKIFSLLAVVLLAGSNICAAADSTDVPDFDDICSEIASYSTQHRGESVGFRDADDMVDYYLETYYNCLEW